MSVTFAIAVYFVIWWTVLFAVLPFGVRSQHDAGTRVPGTPASAPVRPRFLQIVIATSVLAAIVLGLTYLAIAFNLLDRLGFPVHPPADPPPGS